MGLESDYEAEHAAAAEDNSVAEPLDSHAATQLSQTLDFAPPPQLQSDLAVAPEGPATDAQLDLPPEAEPVADFDPEVASIFTDEATELLEVCESQLAACRAAARPHPAAHGAEASARVPQGWRAHGRHHRHG